MKFSTAILSAIAFVGLAQAQGTAGNTSSTTTSRTSNAAVPLHGQERAAAYGLSGAIIAGALAYLV